MKNFSRLLLLACLITNSFYAQQKPNPKNASTKSSISLETLIKQKDNSYVITNDYVAKKTGFRHMYLRQAIDGIEVQGTESNIHFNASGLVIASHNNFLEDIQSTVKNKSVILNARQAITSVANQMHYPLKTIELIKNEGSKNQQAIYNKAGISSEDIPIKLMYYFRKGIGTTIIWELSIAEKNTSDWWNFRVDAASGIIIDKVNFTNYCNILGNHDTHAHENPKTNPSNFIGPIQNYTYNSSQENNSTSKIVLAPAASYRVYAMPVESPNYGGRTLVTNPENLTASPFGWHDTDGIDDAEFTNTRGNNVSAFDFVDSDYTDSPGGNLIFDFPINTVYSSGDQSDDAIVTNLFYWNNIVHDVAYQYGFTEAAGNFQENNYGKGGFGSDSVNAEAQKGLVCNAFFSTPTEGSNPTMEMYVCGSRDGDLDNGVIVHEYGHGISNRLTGGAANSTCLQNTEQMGEGWSDYYALLLTMESGDAGTDARPSGTWLLGQAANDPGGRTHPYSTDLTINPHTYDDIKTESIPHGVGTVWTAMLWEMTWGLIADQGFDTDFYNGTGGNNIALNLVTQGLKLQPCSPGFIDGRDAILAADQALYAGAYQCIIWEAFAKRGLGFSATQGSTDDRSDGTEAFDLPANFSSLNTVETICMSGGIQTGLSGGLPTGGTYSGTGVTDDGNGSTFTFNPNLVGTGSANITYIVNDFCTGALTTLNDQINVTNNPPEIITIGSGNIPFTDSQSSSPAVAIPDNDPTGVTSTMTVATNVAITDLNVNLDLSHTWVGDLIVTIKSPLGTTVTIIDRPGRTTSGSGCSGNNIVAILDDDAVNPVETECAGTEPTISGSFVPENPLSTFDGENTMGDWEITVSDNVGADTGILNSWGITFGYEITSTPLDVMLDATGNATINATELLYSIAVDCGGSTVTGGNPLATTVNFTCTDLGSTNVAVLASNDAGASTSGTAIVNVIDNINPTAIGQNYTADLAGNATVSITANNVDNGSSDNCTFSLSIDVDTFNATGNYPVVLTITDSSGNTDFTTVNVEVIDTTLTIEDYNELDNQITIYPIPTAAILNISTDLEINNITVFDLLGKQIIKLPKPTNTINVSSFSEGVYLLKIQVENKILIKRFVKK